MKMGYFDRFNNEGIAFMENADKANLDEILGERVHIEDFGFIKNDEGDYGVMKIAEKDGVFYFANQVITDMLHQVENDDMRDELPKQVIVFSKATSRKTGREYTKFKFGGDIPF